MYALQERRLRGGNEYICVSLNRATASFGAPGGYEIVLHGNDSGGIQGCEFAGEPKVVYFG